ncbi:MAG: hypothetical protein LBF41_05995, partial [Deltaproteobacteria bacterium]|nr:hypothetical protein [Deltaproteobacteria bacterium]
SDGTPEGTPDGTPVLFDRDKCLEFAGGKIADVFGEEFALADSFPSRVRLPLEPLMLVDRVLSMTGTPKSFGPGSIVTEHDVRTDGWYLDNNRLTPGMAIESGQADLMLCAWLGADYGTKGLSLYRLLDAEVTFHRDPPTAGERARYEIRILKFFRHGESGMFRFEFDGTVAGKPLLTMRNGVAGFFSPAVLASGKGLNAPVLETERKPAAETDPDAVPFSPGEEIFSPARGRRASGTTGAAGSAGPAGSDSFSYPRSLGPGDLALARAGDFSPFGYDDGGPDPSKVTIPSGKLALLDSVSLIDREGGFYGGGFIRAEAAIDPEAWFLVSHFKDDEVMPGTLMYDASLQTLRLYLLSLGWIGRDPENAFVPATGIAASLKCRGQVTPGTRSVAYDVHVKELVFLKKGRGPRSAKKPGRPVKAPAEPAAVADAIMWADGKPIAEVTDMALVLSGATRKDFAALKELLGKGSPAMARGSAETSDASETSNATDTPGEAPGTREGFPSWKEWYENFRKDDLSEDAGEPVGEPGGDIGGENGSETGGENGSETGAEIPSASGRATKGAVESDDAAAAKGKTKGEIVPEAKGEIGASSAKAGAGITESPGVFAEGPGKDAPAPSASGRRTSSPGTSAPRTSALRTFSSKGVVARFGKEEVRAIKDGKFSPVLGPGFSRFDDFFLARLPYEPYSFLDEAVVLKGEVGEVRVGSTLAASVLLDGNSWIHRDAGEGSLLPYAVANEIALQPCGFLATFMGSSIPFKEPMRFRNLGGEAVLTGTRDLFRGGADLEFATVCSLTRKSVLGDMTIQHYDFRVTAEGKTVYEGKTHFGFLSPENLAKQQGVRLPAGFGLSRDGAGARETIRKYPRGAPWPKGRWRLLDEVSWDASRAPEDLNEIRGKTAIDPDAWFFWAHFPGDPVLPGSLGLEAFFQAAKVLLCLKFRPEVPPSEIEGAKFLAPVPDTPHSWLYRGQILPANKESVLSLSVTRSDPASGTLVFSGVLWIDKLPIYVVTDFAVSLE